MTSFDSKLGFDVLMECENGVFRQARQLVFVEKEGPTHHLPIREGTTAAQLTRAVQDLNVKKPFDAHILYDPENEGWVEDLVKLAWPTCDFSKGTLSSTLYNGGIGKVVVTNRYFRAVSKIGFHYFLAVNPRFSGHEEMFSEIKRFILTESDSVDQVNAFVGTRGTALLGEMLNPNVRPNGWRAHILGADTSSSEHLAYVQTFVTGDWSSPVYSVQIARDHTNAGCRMLGHAYIYYGNGLEGTFAGDALPLVPTRIPQSAPISGPAILPAETVSGSLETLG